MKLDVLEENRDVEGLSQEQIEYTVDPKMIALLYKILSQYSNPVGSIVRELVTNAVDSHLEADIDKRVTVRIIKENELTNISNSFEVEDYGVGLSPKRVRETYSQFLGSTKRDSNKEHGAYGLGSKSPFSYTNMFYVTTRYDGIEYFYAVHKGSNVPRIDLMDKQPTDQGNGTTVNINIEPGDRSKFEKEIKRQLAYFDNVNYEGIQIDNDYRIFQGDNFIYREFAKELGLNKLHICLGKVYYPIDFNAVKLESKKYGDVATPIGLKFEIGEIPIVWSRENIEYTDKAIELIQNKYEKAQEELEELYKSRTDDIETIEDYYRSESQYKDNSLELSDGVVITNLDYMIDQKISFPKYEKLPRIPKFSNIVDLVYKRHKVISSGRAKAVGAYQEGVGSVVSMPTQTESFSLGTKTYLVNNAYSTLKNKYLYEEENESYFYLAKKREGKQKPTESEILGTFGYSNGEEFKDIPDDEVALIKDLTLACIKVFKSVVLDYEAIEVPDSFKAEKDSGRTDIYDESSEYFDPDLKIHFKSIEQDNSYYNPTMGGFGVYEPTLRRLNSNRNTLRIYGFQEDSDILQDVGKLLLLGRPDLWNYTKPDPDKIMVLKIARNKEDSLKRFSDNAIHVGEFVSRRHKILVRELTLYHIYINYEYESKFPLGDISKLDFIKEMGLTDFYDKVSKGTKIIRKFLNKRYPAKEGRVTLDLNIPKSIQFILENPAFLDQTLIDEYLEAQAYLEKYPLLYNIITNSITENEYDTLKEELKYYLKGKDSIHPVLLKRFNDLKQKEQDLITQNNEDDNV